MNKLNYNRFFHLHTVTGIVISVILYIIFFAGAFTLFRTEIYAWEKGEPIVKATKNLDLSDINLDNLLKDIDSVGYPVYGRGFYIYKEKKNRIYASFDESTDSLETNRSAYDLIISHDSSVKKLSFRKNTDEKYSLDSLFYNLHFLRQLNQFGSEGWYLALFVSFFFLFAIVTGVIVHWKKIISNFYVFRPLAKLKTVWTDAHTVLGVIGLPFQFMYALTGVMFCATYVFLVPPTDMFPKSITDVNTIEIAQEEFSYIAPKFKDSTYLVAPFLENLKTVWKELEIQDISVENYGNKNSTIRMRGSFKNKKQFYHNASIEYDFATNKVTSLANPNNLSYTKSIYEVGGNLHHADYGLVSWQKHLLIFVYFILTFITCFVIITGVLIWLTARDKKNVPEKQRRFNEQVGYIYMAICLTMFPITAFIFVVSKLLPESLNSERKIILNGLFFGGWFLLSVFFWFKKNNYFTNKYTLLSGGILSLCIPFVNGICSGNWVWRTFANDNDIFVFDMLWITIAIITLYTFVRLKKDK